MYSEWHLDIWKLCFIFTKILCILAKQQAIDIDSCYVEGIRNKEFRYPRRASHNTVDAVEMERIFCQHTQASCKGETEFSNIQMPFGVHTVSDREL